MGFIPCPNTLALSQQPGGQSPPLFQFRRRSFGSHAKGIRIPT